MGRNRLPDKVKKLRGTDQKCRMNNISSDGMIKLPPAPKYLSKTGKKIYKSLGMNLLKSGILTELNIIQFIAYCQEVSIYFEVCESYSTIDSKIETVVTNGGQRTFQTGYAKLGHTSLQNALRIGREFGFTPATISRLNIPTNKKENSFKKFLES